VVTPPPDVPAERLFRLLLGAPRPALPISHRVRGLEDVPLEVRALRPLQEAALYDAVTALEHEESRPRALVAEVVAASLWTPDGPAFDSGEGVGVLYDGEADLLAAAVLTALDIVSPSYRTAEVKAWDAVLAEGARAPANISMALALGGCVEVGWRATPRPDLYFGLALRELTDGQWMAYRAARAFVQTLEKK
jgi:hypothetical protein